MTPQHTAGLQFRRMEESGNPASERVAEKIGMHRVDDDLGGSIPIRSVLSMQL